MSDETDRDDACCCEARDPVQVAVTDAAQARRRARAVAFVWGPEVSPAPSLPFGRWKAQVVSAAA
ncbi:MAG: hypothetical protein AB1941_07240 [Gemmatimonadota bacterium]